MIDLLHRVIGAVIAQLYLLNKIRKTTDITFDSWSYQICTQLVQNLSVITVCIPYIRNVLVGLESGMLRTGAFHLRKLSATTTTNTGSHPSGASKKKPPTADSTRLNHIEDPTGSCDYIEDYPPDVGPFHANNTAVVEASTPMEGWDGESQSGQAKIIKQTTEWRVDYDPHQGPSAAFSSV